MLQVRLLGQFDVQRDGHSIAIASRSAQSLLAFLLLNPGTPHRREKLAGQIWPDASETNSRNNLRRELWRLRKALEIPLPRKRAVSYFVVDEITIAFDAAADYWLDAALLQRANDASTNDLIESLNVYRGELLPGFYDDWVVLERERLRAVFEQKMARLMDVLIADERWRDILDWGERWIALGQTPEPAYRALMTAHSALGDMARVAKTFERCVKALRNDLGVEPSEQTRALYEKLKAGKETPQAAVPIPEIAAAQTRSNIPTPLTRFIGREKELNEIERLLAASRLVTLTGSGGVGKTRLAIQTAHDLVKKFKDGVFWADLVGLSDANLIPQEIAQSLHVREVSSVPLIETLKHDLADKTLLLILDNCEHLIAGAAKTAEELLGACPHLKILVTSRERLGIFNETVWRVPSLSKNTSRQLFVERARAAKHDFSFSASTESFIDKICARLDGIPLAIELAAARVTILSLEEIARRLDDRFALLTSGSRTALPRQQTLRATIDWSYGLLAKLEPVLFRRLAVFAGGFTLEAAEAVCSFGELKPSEVLELLGRLVDKSLVVVEQSAKTGDTRYRLLETIREYTREKLMGAGEEQVVRDRHLEFFTRLAEASQPKMFGGESVLWRNRIAMEIDNLRAAMDWAMQSGKAVAVLRMTGSLVEFWFAHGPLSEWYQRAEDALARPEAGERTAARAKALTGLGFMHWADEDRQDRCAELEEALAIGRQLGDKWIIGTALLNLGMVTNEQGAYAKARALMEESLANWETLGAEGNLQCGRTLSFLGDVIFNQGHVELSRSTYERAVSMLKETGDKNALAYPLRRLGQLAWQAGEYEKAKALCRDSLILNHETADPRGVIASIVGFAAIAAGEGKFDRAGILLAAAEAQLNSNHLRLVYADQIEFARNLALVKTALDEKTLAQFWAQGKAMTLEQAIAFALEKTRG